MLSTEIYNSKFVEEDIIAIIYDSVHAFRLCYEQGQKYQVCH